MFDDFYKKNKDGVNRILFMIAFLALIYLFVKVIFAYISPFVIGYIFSLALNPFVTMLQKKFGVHRGVSTLISIVFVIVLISTLGTRLTVRIIEEGKILFQNKDIYAEEVTKTVEELQNNYNYLIQFIPAGFSETVEKLINSITTSATLSSSNILKDFSVNFVVKVPSFVMGSILCIISTFFFTKDKYILSDFAKKYSPIWLTSKLVTVKGGLAKAVVGYVKAQLILMCVTATICITGLGIIKFPYALLIGFVACLIDALPIFGVGFVLWPLAFFNLVSGNSIMALQLMIIYAIVILTRQFLEPKVLGSQIGVHPLATLISIYVGLQIFGVVGLFVGPLIVIMGKIILFYDSDNKVII